MSDDATLDDVFVRWTGFWAAVAVGAFAVTVVLRRIGW